MFQPQPPDPTAHFTPVVESRLMYRPKQDILVTDLDDELVLLNPETQDIFTLNASGRLLWLALPAPLETLADVLVQEYGLDSATARTDAGDILHELVQAGLLDLES